MGVFLLFIIVLGWVFAQIYADPIILYVAVGFSLLMNVGSYWYSDKLVVKMSGAKPAPEEQYREHHRLVENLAITAGLPKPSLYIIEDSVPNAFATGRDEKHAVVAVTTGILDILDRTELEGVIAHELSHIGNRDILIQTIVVVLAGFVAILSDWILRISIYGGRSDNSKGNMIALVVGLVAALLAPLAATMIKLAVSRKREFLADASGALLTRYPEGLASALEKIEAHSGTMKKVSHATAHLYLSDPYGKEPGFFHKLFMTHPPIRERVAALRNQVNKTKHNYE